MFPYMHNEYNYYSEGEAYMYIFNELYYVIG